MLELLEVTAGGVLFLVYMLVSVSWVFVLAFWRYAAVLLLAAFIVVGAARWFLRSFVTEPLAKLGAYVSRWQWVKRYRRVLTTVGAVGLALILLILPLAMARPVIAASRYLPAKGMTTQLSASVRTSVGYAAQAHADHMRALTGSSLADLVDETEEMGFHAFAHFFRLWAGKMYAKAQIPVDLLTFRWTLAGLVVVVTFLANELRKVL